MSRFITARPFTINLDTISFFRFSDEGGKPELAIFFGTAHVEYSGEAATVMNRKLLTALSPVRWEVPAGNSKPEARETGSASLRDFARLDVANSPPDYLVSK
jgi:hypothetical protein